MFISLRFNDSLGQVEDFKANLIVHSRCEETSTPVHAFTCFGVGADLR